MFVFYVCSKNSPPNCARGRAVNVSDEAYIYFYIVEVGIGEGWNTDVLRLGTTWKMLLNEQQR